MAKSTVSATDALRNELWDKNLFEDMIKETFWKKFWGGSRSAVHVKKELEMEEQIRELNDTHFEREDFE
jgi:hypothetical protein